jgi:uncharacterized protein
MHTATYADIQQVLTQEHSLTDAAEAHGTLAGSLCTAPVYRFEDWVREILPVEAVQPRSAATLRGLFAGTQDALVGEVFNFQPLLPGDAEPINERTAALAQWCVGFLYGLGSSAIPDASKLPGEVGEVVRDFTEITQVGVDSADSEESNESAYAELVEFVRVGVQLLFDELAAVRTPPVEPAGAAFH